MPISNKFRAIRSYNPIAPIMIFLTLFSFAVPALGNWARQQQSLVSTYTQCTVVPSIDWEGFPFGTVITNQFDGVTIRARKNPGNIETAAMIFDSGTPTGEDPDLGTVNQGNILIISEDNNSNDPDDNAHGGRFIFTFCKPTPVTSITFIDIEEPGGLIRCISAEPVIEVPIEAPGNNSVNTQVLNLPGCDRLIVRLVGSGAISDMVFAGDSGMNGDPMITTFGGNTFQTKSTGEYLNSHWGENDPQWGRNKITSCVQPALGRHSYTKAVSYKCKHTTMIAHLSKTTLDTWQSQKDSTTFNVYYFDHASGKFLNDTGDFMGEAPKPAEYHRTNYFSCTEDSKVQLQVGVARTHFQPKKTHYAPMMQMKLSLKPSSRGDYPKVYGGLSQTPVYSDNFKAGVFLSGPNVHNNVHCSADGMSFEDAMNSNPCGPESWMINPKHSIFSKLAKHKGEAYIERCE